MKAATSGSEDICMLLLKAGADPYIKDKRGLTADVYAELTVKEQNLHVTLRDWMKKNAQID